MARSRCIGSATDLDEAVSRWNEVGARGDARSPRRAFCMTKLLWRMLDESEFLRPTACALRTYLDHPYDFAYDGVHYRVKYQPGESDSGSFGGTELARTDLDAGQLSAGRCTCAASISTTAMDPPSACPTGSGVSADAEEVADESCSRLLKLFRRGLTRALSSAATKISDDPHFKDYLCSTSTFMATMAAAVALRIRPAGPGYRQSDQPAGSGRTGRRPYRQFQSNPNRSRFHPRWCMPEGSPRDPTSNIEDCYGVEGSLRSSPAATVASVRRSFSNWRGRAPRSPSTTKAHPEVTAALEQQIAKLGDQSIASTPTSANPPICRSPGRGGEAVRLARYHGHQRRYRNPHVGARHHRILNTTR